MIGLRRGMQQRDSTKTEDHRGGLARTIKIEGVTAARSDACSSAGGGRNGEEAGHGRTPRHHRAAAQSLARLQRQQHNADERDRRHPTPSMSCLGAISGASDET